METERTPLFYPSINGEAASRGPSRASTPPPPILSAPPTSRWTRGWRSERLLQPHNSAGSPGGELEGEDPLNLGCCHPAREIYRLHLLVLLAGLSFASYFCYDIPSAVEDLIKRELEISTSKFALLYSAYCLPNIFLGLVLGLLVDKYVGVRRMVMFSALLSLIGHLLLAVGGHFRMLWLMCIGRFLFGIGGESLAVMQSVFIVAWFRGKELKSVFAITQTFSRLGSVLNLNLTGLLADQFGMVSAMLLGSIICVITLIDALFIAYLDRRAELIIEKPSTEVGDEFSRKDLKKLSRSFWLILLVCCFFYGAFFPFIALGTEFFRYKHPDQYPGTLVSIPYLLSLFGSPAFSYIIDRTQFRVVWVGLGLIIAILSYMIMALTLINPYIPMVMLGFAYSIVISSLWPMVAMLVPSRRLGTAYGVLQATQNFMLTIAPPLLGFLMDRIGYMWALVTLGSMTTLALIFTELLMFFNYVDNEGLNGPTPDEKAKQQRASKRAARRTGGGLLAASEAVPIPSGPSSMLASGVSSFSTTGGTPAMSAGASYSVVPSSAPLSIPGPSPLDLRKRYMTRLGISGPEYKSMALSSQSTLK